MLSAATRKTRVWAAAFLAVFYAFCLLAPAAAVAFGDSEAHCLNRDTHGTSASHVHDDGLVHSHDDNGVSPANDAPDGDGKAAAKCCGLFCVPALAASANDGLAPTGHPYAVIVSSGDALVGGVPVCLYRPPALAI
ncbi:MAG: hypothetical protein K2Y27_14025 [Xanthobacteraceae bacterium]|nr:hypothetical protein [Xanthobacteraceae bacterium]